MRTDLTEISMLARREIEARIAGPLIEAFMKEMGRETGLKVARRVMTELGRQGGVDLAKQMGGDSIAHLAEGHKEYATEDAYEMEVLKLTEGSYHVDIKRCRYAEMYRELGLEELGFILSCTRDFAFTEGFNPNIKLIRTKTLMTGDEVCNYRFDLK